MELLNRTNWQFTWHETRMELIFSYPKIVSKWKEIKQIKTMTRIFFLLSRQFASVKTHNRIGIMRRYYVCLLNCSINSHPHIPVTSCFLRFILSYIRQFVCYTRRDVISLNARVFFFVARQKILNTSVYNEKPWDMIHWIQRNIWYDNTSTTYIHMYALCS